MKKAIFIIFIASVIYSCKKSDDIPVNTKFTHHLLNGHCVTSIAFDHVGNAWIGTCKWKSFVEIYSELLKYNIKSKEIVVYNSANSPITDTVLIYDIAVDSKNNVWIGCDELIKFDGNIFTKYNTENTEIPVKFIHSINVDSKDNIWFSSSSHLEGGLVKYDGKNWTVFTPENSDIPMHGVQDIAIDKNDNIWLAQYRYIEESCLVKISNNKWITYTAQDFGFTPVSWGNIKIDSKNRVCGAIDYTLTNGKYAPRPQAFVFDGTNFKQLQYDNFSNVQSIAIDRNDNIWCKSKNQLAVFDGNTWTVDSLTFKDNWIETIELSSDNNIWIGASNGVFIYE